MIQIEKFAQRRPVDTANFSIITLVALRLRRAWVWAAWAETVIAIVMFDDRRRLVPCSDASAVQPIEADDHEDSHDKVFHLTCSIGFLIVSVQAAALFPSEMRLHCDEDMPVCRPSSGRAQ